MIKRVLYLGYYIKQLDRAKFSLFLNYTAKLTGKSKAFLITDVLTSVFRYDISLLEYFQFGFFEKDDGARKKWAGTGYMYEYQKIMNPPSKRDILNDKTLFYKNYKDFFKHHVYTLDELKSDSVNPEKLWEHPTIVLKETEGKCGLGTAFVRSADYDTQSLIAYMSDKGFDLAETFVQQHPELNRLSPSGVNTVRIFTQLNARDEVEILGCRQRISVDSPVDNLAAGNLAAPIDETTGLINDSAVYSDITKPPEEKHPVTGVPINGFQVPYWPECLSLAKRAALRHPQNRSIGWDIVVTPNGPGLIEGNHDWCKLVWQLPVHQGLRHILESHI